MSRPQIRAAVRAELDHLVTLEVQAGRLFHSVDMPLVADHVPDKGDLQGSLDQGHIWVAEQDGQIAGYGTLEIVDGNAHVEQVSVAPAHARQGIGRLLMENVESWGRTDGHPATTLTTFRDVPWNGPYYQRLGYHELAPSAIGPQLAAHMAYEATFPGIDVARRCAMIKSNSATS